MHTSPAQDEVADGVGVGRHEIGAVLGQLQEKVEGAEAGPKKSVGRHVSDKKVGVREKNTE